MSDTYTIDEFTFRSNRKSARIAPQKLAESLSAFGNGPTSPPCPPAWIMSKPHRSASIAADRCKRPSARRHDRPDIRNDRQGSKMKLTPMTREQMAALAKSAYRFPEGSQPWFNTIMDGLIYHIVDQMIEQMLPDLVADKRTPLERMKQHPRLPRRQ